MTRPGRRGTALVEFTLTGVPLIFILIGIFEISRGMWIYHTLSHAVKEGSRFASVHGRNCKVPPNACAVTLGQIARRIATAGVGLAPNEVTVTFTSLEGSVQCTLAACLSDPAVWPPTPADTPGQAIEIRAAYPFRSAIALFWPGAADRGPFPAVTLPASSLERIQF